MVQLGNLLTSMGINVPFLKAASSICWRHCSFWHFTAGFIFSPWSVLLSLDLSGVVIMLLDLASAGEGEQGSIMHSLEINLDGEEVYQMDYL